MYNVMKINYYSTKGILLSKQFLYRTTRGQYCFNQDLWIFFANQILLTEVCKTWSFCYLCRNVIIKFSGMKIAAHITVRKESSRLINVRNQGFFFNSQNCLKVFTLFSVQDRAWSQGSSELLLWRLGLFSHIHLLQNKWANIIG